MYDGDFEVWSFDGVGDYLVFLCDGMVGGLYGYWWDDCGEVIVVGVDCVCV